MSLTDLGSGTYQIDVYEMGIPERTAVYVLRGDRTAVIEAGPTPGAPRVLGGLEALGVRPEEVEHLIVTHVHLDHAGATGYLLRHLPNALVWVHPKGARHLHDPSRLVAGAREIYGPDFDRLFGEVVPVPAERLRSPADGETLDLGGRVLTFLETPGHAPHCLSVYDSATRGVFPGDAAGLRIYALVRECGRELILPSAVPPQFDPGAAIASARRLRALEPEFVYFTHFGRAAAAVELLDHYCDLVGRMAELAQEVVDAGGDWPEFRRRYREWVGTSVLPPGCRPDSPKLAFDLDLNSRGLFQHFVSRRS
ncbi:MAG: MBL fold metallo-hydrolase [Firmicutes bacterium]|nr:MBL fold metallo-hydrolase [Bacillota bacterium]